jgi:hypothetical protein
LKDAKESYCIVRGENMRKIGQKTVFTSVLADPNLVCDSSVYFKSDLISVNFLFSFNISLILGTDVLMLLILRDMVGHVALSLGEQHLVHTSVGRISIFAIPGGYGYQEMRYPLGTGIRWVLPNLIPAGYGY